MRCIPRGMDVDYLKKATGDMRAVATLQDPPRETADGYELPVRVEVLDASGEAVFRASIRMWVSPRPM